MGAAPTRITPSAPVPATTPSGIPANLRTSARPRPPGPRPERRGVNASPGVTAVRWHGGPRVLRHPEVPGGEQHDQRHHRIRVGAEPAEEAEVLHEHPVGEAADRRYAGREQGEPGAGGCPPFATNVAAHSPAPVTASAMTTTRLTANPCAAVKLPKPETTAATWWGWEVPAMSGSWRRASPACHAACPARSRVPATPEAVPCRGRTRRLPQAATAESGPSHARSGSATSAPATA